MAKSLRDRLRAGGGGDAVVLSDIDPDATTGIKGRDAAEKQFDANQERLRGLQERLYAEDSRSLLLVLQGMDTSGKDGTISHVVGSANPQGLDITAFKAPTPEERRHDFLWRIRKRLPPPGQIGIFNRSHYEDVLVVRVENLVPPGELERRYGQINRFEEQLRAGGTRVVKICLHISFEEQRKRLVARLLDPTKRWKFRANDLDVRQRWEDYMAAYSVALTRCSTESAPWYVVPADHKWYRNWAVSRILIEELAEMNPKYPEPRLDIPALLKRLGEK